MAPRPSKPTRPAPPTKLTVTTIINQRGGKDITVGDFIIQQLTAGVDPDNAANAAGVSRGEYRAWMREGVEGLQRIDNGAEWNKDFTPEQQDVIAWAVEARRAHGRHIASLATRAQQLATGAPLERVVETRDKDGKLIETRTTTETQPPDGPTVRWLLERLAPDTYGRDVKIDVTMHDITDTETVRTRTEEIMHDILERYAAGDLPNTDDDAATDG